MPETSKYFIVQEFVPPTIYSMFGVRSWWYINPVIVGVVEHLRRELDQPLIINNWHVGGQYRFRGYRPPQCTVGAKYSMHRLGMAVDVSVKGMTPANILQVIESDKQTFLELGLTTIEDINHTPSWVHLDCRPHIEGLHPANDFLFVKP